MKQPAIFLQIIMLLVIGCTQMNRGTNQFSSGEDELTIETLQHKGLGLWMYFAGLHTLRFNDSARYEDIVPSGLSNITYAHEVVDYNILGYMNTVNAGKGVNKYYKNLISESKIDTSNLPSYKDNSICIIEATKGQDTVFIVDQNNNKDFRDDTVRLWKEMDPFSKDLVKVDYRIYNGEEYVSSSNWLNIGIWDGRKSFSATQYYSAKFEVDTSQYEIDLFIRDCRKR